MEGLSSRLSADWVFAYGSLIWNPEFEYVEHHIARLHGYHRRFCVRSTLYRGTPERPGVVLGLAPGGSVQGVAFRIKPGEQDRAIENLYAREMVQNIYIPKVLPARLMDGRTVQALCFVANRKHEAYLAISEAQIVARLQGCCGARGPNVEYARNTHEALHRLGIQDASLARLVKQL